ncbi:serine hydrolase [Singulisphaera sp. GP187]|uniref:serine hydrolase n=1 Tax=Singulisphaera sp. GP187 TaxID=1882752 RepID=UPI0020B14328|nr:serine hydrolase [Singulisphaera sp. GP187]
MLGLLGFALIAPHRVPGVEPGRAAKAADLERTLRAIVEPAGEVAVVYTNLADGEQVFIKGDERIHPASTMKVPVMMEVFRQAELGTLALDGGIRLKNDFVSIADGSRFTLDVAEDSEKTLYRHLGEERPVRELVRLMITESSNLATNLLIERVTAPRVSELMKAMGAGDVRVLRGVEDNRAFERGLNNETTARGLATILQQLAARRVVSVKASEEMLAILRGQKFNEGIPAGLPAGVPVAHKTGSITAIAHDAGVIEPAGRAPYVLVVLTRGIKDSAKAHELIARVSRVVYEHTLGQ